jgi:hypothetical protein
MLRVMSACKGELDRPIQVKCFDASLHGRRSEPALVGACLFRL